MSNNSVTIVPTVFLNLSDNSKTFGVRVYDDYEQAYDNTWDSIPDSDMGILQKALESKDKILGDIMDFVFIHKKSVKICRNLYDWEDIKEYFPRIKR